jgi:hypothetical protein
MAESFDTEFTIVELTRDDVGSSSTQMWVALARPNQELTLVLAAVPEGWTAQIFPANLTEKQRGLFEQLKLKHGDVIGSQRSKAPGVGTVDE